MRAGGFPRALLGDQADAVTYARALRGLAMSVRLEDPGLRVRFVPATDASSTRAEDLPLAAGAPPRTRNATTAGARSPAGEVTRAITR
jgi:hypothetical protein